MRLLLSCLLLILLCPSVHGQTYYSNKEWGVSVGGSQYFGDLNERYGFREIHPVVGGFARFHLTPYIALRTSLLYTQVGYSDVYNTNLYQKQRNLSFKSPVAEASVQAEFNFFRYATGELGNRFTPYLTGGMGAFYYEPYAEVNDRRYSLRRLGTEGQNAGYTDRRYHPIGICFPVGMGIKYWLRPGLNLGIEVANRLTLTDYLDDVSKTYVGADLFPNDQQNPNPAFLLQDRSPEIQAIPLGRAGKQRGNDQSFDQYLMVGVHLSLQLTTYRCPQYLKEGYYMY